MTDLDTGLRAAVDGATAATVAPPFAAVERRARARRNRQVAGVAAGIVAVLAAGALALPRDEARTVAPVTGTGLKPAEEFETDTEAQAAYNRCLRRHAKTYPAGQPDLMYLLSDSDACFREVGYEPARGMMVSVGGVAYVGLYLGDESEDAETARCWTPPEPGAAGSRTIASGHHAAHDWYVQAWTGPDETRCIGWRLDPAVESMSMDRDNDTGPAGALDAKLSWDLLSNTKVTDAVIWWGAVAPEVVRLEFTLGGEAISYDTVDGGDRRYVGIVLAYPDGTKHADPVGYDAQGRRVTLPDPTP